MNMNNNNNNKNNKINLLLLSLSDKSTSSTSCVISIDFYTTIIFLSKIEVQSNKSKSNMMMMVCCLVVDDDDFIIISPLFISSLTSLLVILILIALAAEHIMFMQGYRAILTATGHLYALRGLLDFDERNFSSLTKRVNCRCCDFNFVFLP